jgi:hypothetical protein
MLNIFKKFWIEFIENLKILEEHGFVLPFPGMPMPIIFNPELMQKKLDEKIQNED